MRKSKADTAETRKRILATAANVFLQQGISGTAISDVMVAAGLTQGAFYRHFESKDHLVAESMRAAFEEVFAALEQATVGHPSKDAIGIVVNRYLNQHFASGQGALCPLAHLSSELRLAADQVKLAAVEGHARFVRFIASYLMRLDYADYLGLAESIVSVLVGAVAIASLSQAPKASEAVLVNARKTVAEMLDDAAASASRAAPH